MTFGELCTTIEKLISECGVEGVLLATAMEIRPSHPEIAETIDNLIFDSKTQKGR